MLAAVSVGIILLGGLLRFAFLATLPAGLSRDEDINILDEATISWTNLPVFFGDNSGREALFFYWQHLWTLGLGVSPFSVRLAAASLGVLCVALEIAVMRRFFGWRVGLFAGAILATMYWAVQDTRIGLRFTMTPLFTLLAIATLYHAARRRSVLSVVLAGATIGLAANSYTSADALVLLGVASALYALVAYRVALRTWLTGVTIGLAAYAVMIAPLVWYFHTNTVIFGHIQDLRAVGEGGGLGATIASVAHNVAAYAWSIAGAGDIQWVQNVSGKPVYDWLMGALCYGGVAWLLWRVLRRTAVASNSPFRNGAALCLLALLATYLPGIVSRDAPYYPRVFGAAPIIAVAPALSLDLLWRRSVRRLARPVAIVLVAIPLVVQTLLTTHDFFITWATAPDAQLRHGSGPAAIASYLNGSHPSGALYVSTNDPEGIRALAPAGSTEVHWFHADSILPLPMESTASSLYLLDLATPYYNPDTFGLYDGIEDLLRASGVQILDAADQNAHIPVARGYEIQGRDAFNRLIPDGPHVAFGYKVGLLGARVEPITTQAGAYRVLLGLRAGDNAMGYARISVSAVDSAGTVWGQTSLRGLDTSDWRAGQVALSMPTLELYGGTPSGDVNVEVSVWDTSAGRFIPIGDSASTSVNVGTITVERTIRGDVIHPLPAVTRSKAVLGGIVRVLGFQLSSETPRQGAYQRIGLLWECLAPLPANAHLDAALVDSSGVELGQYKPGGLVAPPPDQCQPGVPWLDQRFIHVGARWSAGNASVVASLRDGAGRQLGDARIAEVTIQPLPRATEVPKFERRVGATFDDGFELLGITTGQPYGSRALPIDLVWRALAAPTRDYTVFVHVLGPRGVLIAQHDGTPAGGEWPASFWEQGQVVVDRHVVMLPTGMLQSGSFLEVGLYDPTSGERLHVLDAGDAQAKDDALRLPLVGDR